MQRVAERVFVGNETDCAPGSAERAVVHACKTPCHQRHVGYTGNLPSTHDDYMLVVREHDLYINLIDPPVPLFKPTAFDTFLAFAAYHWSHGSELLIHCNQGQSRAPSLALLFMAKFLRVLPDTSYAAARAEFEKVCTGYAPGKGIETFLTDQWASLGCLT